MSKLFFTLTVAAIATVTGFNTSQAQTSTARGTTAQGNQVGQSQANGVSQTQTGPTVKEAILKKLMKANEAEIELAKMAGEKTDSDELKELTQMIVKDHEALNEELKKCCEMKGSDQANLNQGNQNQANQNQATNTRVPQTQYNYANSQAAKVPQELCNVGEQACENALKMTKEMLGKYDGEEFDMAFLGQQCMSHMMMLAELKAIESEGPVELREVASKAAKKVEEHLEKVKEMAKDRKDG